MNKKELARVYSKMSKEGINIKEALKEIDKFKKADTDDNDNGGTSGGGFQGKGPGGAGGTKNAEHEAKKAQALAMLGIKKEEK